MNTKLLLNSNNNKEIEQVLKTYFEDSWTGEVSCFIAWDTIKAVIHWQCISLASWGQGYCLYFHLSVSFSDAHDGDCAGPVVLENILKTYCCFLQKDMFCTLSGLFLRSFRCKKSTRLVLLWKHCECLEKGTTKLKPGVGIHPSSLSLSSSCYCIKWHTRSLVIPFSGFRIGDSKTASSYYPCPTPKKGFLALLAFNTFEVLIACVFSGGLPWPEVARMLLSCSAILQGMVLIDGQQMAV